MQRRPGGRERCAQGPGTPAGHAAQTWRQGALCRGTRVTQRSPRGRERCAQVPAPGTPPGHTAQPWRQGELCTGTRVTRRRPGGRERCAQGHQQVIQRRPGGRERCAQGHQQVTQRRPGGRERCAQGPGTPAGHAAQTWRQGALCTGTRDTSRSRSADLEAGALCTGTRVTQRSPGGRECCAQVPGSHSADQEAGSAVHRYQPQGNQQVTQRRPGGRESCAQGHQQVTQRRPGGRECCAQVPASHSAGLEAGSAVHRDQGHTAQGWRQGALCTGTRDTSRSHIAALEAGSAVHRDQPQGHRQVTQCRPGGRERCAQGPGTPAGHTAQTWRQGALCTCTRDTSRSRSADLEAGSAVHRDQGHQQVTQRRPGGRERCAQGPGTPAGHAAQTWRQGVLCTGTRDTSRSHRAGLEAGSAVHRDQGHQQVTQLRPGGRERCAHGPGTPAGHTAQAWRQGALCTGTRDTSRSRSSDLEAGSAVHRDQGHQQVTRRRPGGRGCCAQGPGTPAGHAAQTWRQERCAQGPGSHSAALEAGSAVHRYQGHTAQTRRRGALCTGTSPRETSRSRRAGLEAGRAVHRDTSRSHSAGLEAESAVHRDPCRSHGAGLEAGSAVHRDPCRSHGADLEAGSAVHRDQGHQQVTQSRARGRERCAQGPGTPAGHTAQAWRQGELCTGTRDTSRSCSADLEAGSAVHRDQGHQQVMQRRPGGRERCAQGPGSHSAALEAGSAVHRYQPQGPHQVTQHSRGGRESCAQGPGSHGIGLEAGSAVHRDQGHQQVTQRRPGGRERCAQGPGTPAGHAAQTWRQGALCTGTRDTSRSRSAGLEAGSAVHRDQGHQQVTQRSPGGRERCPQVPAPRTPAGHAEQA
ncbi:hypothetical protein NDU88_000621 [Pleurodeles waltl]|uniref:Uncharacterized protein n=1 Tax=Pleurodeles waltl TaxID=8319 RepID=A0AAV7V7E4_PLEWA|nr:hypothetical protein NDU88_000621 [Pleurodeles waltl]